MANNQYTNKVVLADGEPKTDDAITNYELVKDLITDFESARAPEAVVDAIYGTGFRGELSCSGLEAVQYINEAGQAGALVFALDIPSGMGGDLTDEAALDPNTVRADHTVTFHARKPVHMQKFAGKYCGRIHTIDIGIKGYE